MNFAFEREFMEYITSKTNEKIKYAVKLRESASFRKNEGLFFTEGARLSRDVALTGKETEILFVTEEANLKYKDYVESIRKTAKKEFIITNEIAEKLSDTKNSQGVFCIFKMLDKIFDLGKINYYGKYIVLEDVSNPQNFGAICRTAEAVGLNGVIVKGGCDIYNPKVQRASMGSLFRLDVFETDDLPELLSELKNHGMKVYSSVPEPSAVKITEINKDCGMAVVIGNEGNGITEETKNASTLVTIPMNGFAESLNASAAATIIMWEMMR